MRNFILLLLIFGLLTSCVSNRRPKKLDNICEIYKEKRQWQRHVKKIHKKWGVPPYTIMAIIHQESRFNAKARPVKKTFGGKKRISSAYGYSQALDGTWRHYQQAVDSKSAKRTNFRDSVDFMGWYIHTNSRRNKIAKHDTYNQYLAYHEGMGGYQRNTHQAKPWLLAVAKKVSRRADLYRRQLHNC